MKSLSEILRKDVPIEQTDERMAAFNALKAMLTTPPILAMPNDEGQWVVDVDCSAFAIGAVAQQWQNGELKVIEYASRTLNRAERSYCANRRKLLAMIFALKHFRSYLLSHHFVCRVDHMALKYYQSTAEPLGQQARFLDFLAEFDFDLQYKAGKDLTNYCDSLSRIRPCEVVGGMPCKQCNRRITGTHVASIMTRAQKRRLQSDGPQEGVDDQVDGFSPGEIPLKGSAPVKLVGLNGKRKPVCWIDLRHKL